MAAPGRYTSVHQSNSRQAWTFEIYFQWPFRSPTLLSFNCLFTWLQMRTKTWQNCSQDIKIWLVFCMSTRWHKLIVRYRNIHNHNFCKKKNYVFISFDAFYVDNQVPVILEASTLSLKLRKRRSLVLERLNQAPVDGSSGPSSAASSSCSSQGSQLDF
jgi:hypothetical protein